VDSIDAIISLLGKSGPLGAPLAVLCWLWWTSNQERKDLNKQLVDLSAKSIAAEGAMAHSLDLLAAKLKI
jgi:hypothetical protein